ncbi:hypothetical protein HPB48_005416 [Haemaphysalis longicornis]|uniref:guanylate cyclase n=1 Tax=Haemaphysalis longicornis TaxID=44386 RepID=A0A9J6GG62_HAELO|nr:hypothetical protein HPB48_005416 [Haemaphysalis longicornis]
MAQAVASKLHHTEVQVEQLLGKEDGLDHVQFAIRETGQRARTPEPELEDFLDAESLQEKKISPATFCRAFPFHVMFDRSLAVVQAGNVRHPSAAHPGAGYSFHLFLLCSPLLARANVRIQSPPTAFCHRSFDSTKVHFMCELKKKKERKGMAKFLWRRE